jgi:3-dehydroquinate synthase
MLCSDLHSALEPILARYEDSQIVVVRDEAVSGLGISELAIRVSEASKSLETVQQIWDFFFAQGLTRRALVIAIGGGVLTDIVGFAAATYKRGIDYLNIPTTLLAMIDASSGGKTGINYHGLKNSIGAFAQPIETLIWPGWLKTLPAKEFLSGFGEMLKTGLLSNRLWNPLLQYDLDRMDIEELTPLITQGVAIKEQIVAADPHEEGLRKVLNFGHTFGHALEEVTGDGLQVTGAMPHGYAVVYGLIAELYLSVVKLGCPKEPLQQLTQIMLHYYGKPQCKCSEREQLIRLMQQDKKNERAAEINCTLIRSVGDPVINQVITPDEAHEALDYLFSL